jgi:hypothetical protein
VQVLILLALLHLLLQVVVGDSILADLHQEELEVVEILILVVEEEVVPLLTMVVLVDHQLWEAEAMLVALEEIMVVVVEVETFLEAVVLVEPQEL